MSESEGARSEVATLAGGCFWCLEAVFEQLRGVRELKSGYAGGATPNPTYEQVCTGATGHAEVVQITFDPREVSYREILEVFFTIHDPTTPNRQGGDVGTQYRSAIFYHSPEQEATAESVMKELAAEGLWRGANLLERQAKGEIPMPTPTPKPVAAPKAPVKPAGKPTTASK